MKSLNGTDDGIDYGNIGLSGTTYGIGVWINAVAEAANTKSEIWNKLTATVDWQRGQIKASLGDDDVEFEDDDGSTKIDAISTSQLMPSATWKRAWWVKDGSGHRIYVDGVLAVSDTTTNLDSSNTNNFEIAAAFSNNFFQGKLDELQVLNEAPTTDWLTAEFNNQSSPSTFLVDSTPIAAGTTSALTGTATSSITEADIVTGGKTVILTLAGDTWVAAGSTFNAQRQNIINGLDSAQAETLGWDAEVKAKEVVTAVVRTSSTVVTITLSASASYNITAQETITATIPATALVTSSTAVVASPTFTVDFTASGGQLMGSIAGLGGLAGMGGIAGKGGGIVG